MHGTWKVNGSVAAIAAAMLVAPATAEVVNYNFDVGGNNTQGPSGLSARGTWTIAGNQLTVLLENTSTGAPSLALVADTLLVSAGFNLPGGITIVSGDSANIGPGSMGLGMWSGRGPGDSVAEEWLWTNDRGGDLMIIFDQVISTSEGQNGPTSWGFVTQSLNPMVDGPWGGMTSSPPQLPIPASRVAVEDSIEFTLTLSGTLTQAELRAMVADSWVEFGSDFQYMAVPGPGALPMLLLPLLGGRRRRR